MILPALVERYDYDPYGHTYIESGDGLERRTASKYGNPFAWTGQRYDAGVGLYQFACRAVAGRERSYGARTVDGRRASSCFPRHLGSPRPVHLTNGRGPRASSVAFGVAFGAATHIAVLFQGAPKKPPRLSAFSAA